MSADSEEQLSMKMGVGDQSLLMQIYMEEMSSWKKLHPNIDPKDDPEMSFLSPFFSHFSIFSALGNIEVPPSVLEEFDAMVGTRNHLKLILVASSFYFLFKK